MNLGIIKTGARHIGDILSRNSPTILTWIGVSGVVTTVVLAVDATPKAMNILDEERFRREKDSVVEGYGLMPRPITKMEVIKLTWKCYVPTIAVGIATITCIIGANSINLSRNAALAGLYSLTETAFKEYQAKVVETLGQRKEDKIHDELAQDKLNKNPVDGQVIIETGVGNTLCYEAFSGRYFKSDMETIRRIQNDFNLRIIHDFWRPLNELYDDLGLEPVDAGKDIGWTTDCPLDIRFTSKIATNGQPCIVLEYKMEPRNL